MSQFSQICQFFPSGFFSWGHTHIYVHLYPSINLSISPNSVSSCLNFLTSEILTQYIKKTQRMADCILHSFSVHEKNQTFPRSNYAVWAFTVQNMPMLLLGTEMTAITWVSQALLRSATLQSISYASHSHCISWHCTDNPPKVLQLRICGYTGFKKP